MAQIYLFLRQTVADDNIQRLCLHATAWVLVFTCTVITAQQGCALDMPGNDQVVQVRADIAR